MSTHDITFLAEDRFAALVGVKLVQLEPGYAKAKVDIEDKHMNAANIVQGGVTFTLADFAFAAASNAYGQVSLGIHASIDYFKSPQGKMLVAEAQEIHKNDKLATYNVNVFDEGGDIIARFSGTAYRTKGKIATESKC